MSVIQETKKKMEGALDHLRDELKGIRTGQANPAMLDNVMVDVYGAMMRIRDVANVTTPEPRQLLITPYDASNTPHIGKAIEKANLGFMPNVDGNLVRINIPPMDESLRKEMARLCGKFREDAKISIRNARRDGNEAIRKQKSDGEIPEDQMKRSEKEIQELTDKFCKEADEISANKEKEIMTV